MNVALRTLGTLNLWQNVTVMQICILQWIFSSKQKFEIFKRKRKISNRDGNMPSILHGYIHINIFIKKMKVLYWEGQSSEIRKYFFPMVDSEQVDVGSDVCVIRGFLLHTFRTYSSPTGDKKLFDPILIIFK